MKQNGMSFFCILSLLFLAQVSLAEESHSAEYTVEYSSSNPLDTNYKALPKKADDLNPSQPPTAIENKNTESAGAELDQMFEACTSAQQSAIDACGENNPDLKKSKMDVTDLVQMGSLMSKMDIRAACSKFGKAATIASVGIGSYRVYCSSQQDSCIEKCDEVVRQSAASDSSGSAATAAKEIIKSCKALETKMKQAGLALQDGLSSIMLSRQCAQLSAGDPTAEYCKNNPTAAGCGPADCSGDMATTNPVCICQNDPNNSVCAGLMGKMVQNGAGGLNGDGSAGSADGGSSDNLKGGGTSAALNSLLSGVSNSEEITPRSPGAQKAEDGVGGKKGGGANLGGGSDGGGARNKNNGVAGQDPINPLNGYYGGGGGGGSNYGARSGSSSSAGGKAYGQKNTQPHLADFLPGGSLGSRGPSGMVGSIGIDGVTGPHSDIWKKINNRYLIYRTLLISN